MSTELLAWRDKSEDTEPKYTYCVVKLTEKSAFQNNVVDTLSALTVDELPKLISKLMNGNKKPMAKRAKTKKLTTRWLYQ